MTALQQHVQSLQTMQTVRITGRVAAVRGLTVLVNDLPLPIGATVRLQPSSRAIKSSRKSKTRGEVVGFEHGQSIIMLFDGGDGVSPGMRVISEHSAATATVGTAQLGRIINAFGEPLDDYPRPADTTAYQLYSPPGNAMKRALITQPLPTGVRAIDSMLTVGKGQRIGIFSGPGVGKSSLLASIARHTSADINVIALIGERGREVREFIERTLGTEGLARSVVIVSTGDESPLQRIRAAHYACCVAEYFRDRGDDVMFMMDSITRFAQAQRQVGLAAGEPPATKGYTPSVFAKLGLLLERAGNTDTGGSITGFYTVLVEGDDLTEPVADAARGLLDGHFALSRRLASKGHYPAIDLLESISRVADSVCDDHHIRARRLLRRLTAAYAESEELISIGAYARGSNPDTDIAIDIKTELDQYFQQSLDEAEQYPRTCRRLIELAGLAETKLQQAKQNRPGREHT